MKKERTLKLVAIGSMLAISIFTVSCDKLNGLEPKSFADIFEDKIVGEWTVDSIKYTTFDINNKKTDETIKPAGKVTFVRTDDSKGADLRAAQGYMFNTYLKDGKNLKDTTAYSYDINGNSLNYPFYPNLNTSSAAVFGTYVYNAANTLYVPNPDLKWETVSAQEIGLELNAFNSRLHFEANYFNKTTNDLMTYIGRAAIGLKDKLVNGGSLKNWGVVLIGTGFLLPWTIIITKR